MLGAVVAGVLFLARSGPPAAVAPAPGAAAQGLGGAPGDGSAGRASGIEALESAARAPSSPQAAAQDARRFDGRGTIRGTLETVGASAPREWTLVLTPSRSLVGSEQAVSRTQSFAAGESEFELSDLPLGGYDVRAAAAGLDGSAVPVLLQRASREAYVVLHLGPAGFIEGSVEERDRGGIDELEIFLVADEGGACAATRTDARGWFTFPSVVAGRYRLYVGALESPLTAALSLDFAPPSMRVPPIVLEPLGEVAITVLDARGVAPVGAVVSGTCNRGGSARATVDAFGVALARRLPPGRWRFRVEDALLGRGFAALDVGSGERTTARIDLEAP